MPERYGQIRIKYCLWLLRCHGRVQKNFRRRWDCRHGLEAQCCWGWKQGGGKKVILHSLDLALRAFDSLAWYPTGCPAHHSQHCSEYRHQKAVPRERGWKAKRETGTGLLEEIWKDFVRSYHLMGSLAWTLTRTCTCACPGMTIFRAVLGWLKRKRTCLCFPKGWLKQAREWIN